MERYKIDDVAKQFGLTKRTIRYYEEIGLLIPAERTEGGFRLYTDEHMERLQKIINARDVLGFSLQEIQTYVSLSEELNQYREAAKKHSISDEEKLSKLKEIEKMVAKQLALIDQKMDKMKEIRTSINDYYNRIQDAIIRITPHEERE